MEYSEYWDKIDSKKEELNSLISSYWDSYSHMGTWQFWTVVALLLFPLVILYFLVDRKRIFELFFFGYTVHVLWTYFEIALERLGLFVHTYFLTPIFPYALSMTASALPVGFLLVYQYCTNRNKNFYLYTLVLSAIFAFGFASVEDYLGLLSFDKGMNQFYLFLIDIVIVFISYRFTLIVKALSNGRST
ncbi:hypothetical protein FS935_15750 [Metabacillus litoralis]|uniref:Uncharacterized protein n=1 Tax=Metabacillus litoralis TaxID=152268 RepID=A0A5C6VYU5_9BACI|nr:hypothetical protein [Metabacillus litoralis]TXC89815.1 hypothetical protein FS935_15750 [Metabacillus litoralis]